MKQGSDQRAIYLWCLFVVGYRHRLAVRTGKLERGWNSASAGPRGQVTDRGKSGPPTGAHTPHNRQPQRRAPLRRRPPLPAVRPAVRGGYRRSGRLHAPEAARTGPVSAFRPYFSWTPQGQWFNGQNGHFSCQPGRNHVGTPPGPYGSGFNGPRAVFLLLPTIHNGRPSRASRLLTSEHVTSTGTFFEAMFRGQGRPGNTAGGAGNAFDSKKSTIFVKKNRLFSPHLVHVRAEGAGARGPIFVLLKGRTGAHWPNPRSPGVIRQAQAAAQPPTQLTRRWAAVFRGQSGLKSPLNYPPFEATRLFPT